MKAVVMIPYWAGYAFPKESMTRRDTVSVGGRSLMDHTVQIANGIPNIDDVIIYASNDDVLKQLRDASLCKFFRRPSGLDDQGVSIEDIIGSFLSITDADVIILMHPKSPFLRPKSIAECMDKVVNEGFDSAFVATSPNKLAWFRGQPLNYSLAKNEDTPSMSSIDPVILESSSVYVFTRALFESSRRRIGSDPFIKIVGHFEGFEIDQEDDHRVADLIMNAGLESYGE